MPRNERHVVPHGNGWAIRKPGSDRVSDTTTTQRDAIDRAREILANNGGGEIVIHRPNGTTRDSNTVPPGNDPNPPRDRGPAKQWIALGFLEWSTPGFG